MPPDLDALELRLKQLESANDKGKPAAFLAQFYVAEYSVMMTRVSAWANLQYTPWPILVAALGFVFQLDAPANFRMWAAVILTLVVYVAYQGTMVNSLYYVLLIEKYLRPRARKLVQTDDFWIHERVFQKTFPPNPGWWPYWPPLFSFVTIAAGAIWSWRRYGSDLVNLVGVAAAVSLGLFIAILTKNGKKLKDGIIESCNKSTIAFDEGFPEATADSKVGADKGGGASQEPVDSRSIP